MARYPELIVERATDDSVAINNVSNTRRTQPEPAFNIVQPAYLPRSIAPKVERSSDGLIEALHSVHAIGTNPDSDLRAEKALQKHPQGALSPLFITIIFSGPILSHFR